MMKQTEDRLPQKSKSKRLGKMSSKSLECAAEIISDVLTRRLSGLQTVQTVTLYTSGMRHYGVFALLDRLVKEVSAFGILESSLHYGEAMDEDFSPAESEQMRVVMWNSEPSAIAEFCDLYSGMVEVSHDDILWAATYRSLPVEQAVKWIAHYAKSPIANYECDPEPIVQVRPITAQLEQDDLYKAPCYRWRVRRKHLDRRTGYRRLDNIMLAHGCGIRVKEEALNHPQWPWNEESW